MREIRRPHGRGALACCLVFAALVAATSACGLNQEGVPPPRDRIVYPSSARLDPGGRWLYVANSNSDLRYNNGTLVAVDLDAVRDDHDATKHQWKVCPRADYVRGYDVAISDGVLDKDGIGRCCWDYLDHSVLDCDERQYVHAESTIEIGSFAAGMEFQPTAAEPCTRAPATTRHGCSNLCPPDDGGQDAAAAQNDSGVDTSADGGVEVAPPVTEGRIFLGVRGNSSITYIDTELGPAGAPRLSCGAATKDSKDCSIAHTVEKSNVPTLSVPDEPYALYLDHDQDLLYVGHLRGDTAHADTGGVSLFDVAHPKERPPAFLRASGSLFPSDPNGFFGITSLKSNVPYGHQLYATSRYIPLAVGLSASVDAADLCTQDSTTIFVSGSSLPFPSPLAGAELRGLEFVSSTRAFALQRIPPALIGFDVTGGVPGNVATDIVETCAAPTFLQSFGEGAAKRLFVTCFEAGQIYVVDPSLPGVVALIDAGRGPAGLVFPTPTAMPARAYVVGFGHNNVSVIDLEPGSSTQYHVIHKLGFPSVLPR
jgi:hypothetical protein